MIESVKTSKEEILILLKKAFSSGVFSYADLAEIECQKILNDFIESKFNSDDINEINVFLDNKKIKNNFTEIVSSNYFYNYTNGWSGTH
jgi:hypothetical protein